MLTPHTLVCEYLANPLGLDVRRPRLSWQATAERRGARQTAYQVVVSAEPATPAEPVGTLWDSGKVLSDRSAHIEYGGAALQPGQRCAWRVRVWDEYDTPSPWSASAWWEMGLLDSGNWQAVWVTPDWDEDTSRPQPATQLRRSFHARPDLARARLYITSLGLYEARLNGRRVGDALLTPGWTSYDRRLQYQTYDVTDLMSAGDNALGVLLGDGWYRGYLGHKGHRNVYGERLALLVQLHLTYADGHVELVCSDDAWRASHGPILMSDLYKGEVYDARLEQPGWDTPGYDDRDWQAVRRLEHPTDIVVAQLGAPVRRQESIRPLSIVRSPKGETILDFGQNMVGWVRVRLRGPAGTTITLRHAEVLDPQGNLYTENLRTADQVTHYTLKGTLDADEVFEPHFSFQGFRYVAVEGWPGQPRLDDFAAIVISSDMAQTGTFECSHPLINQLQHNIVWGQKGNFVDVPTDCPQRDERLGWTGDTQVFIRTACFNMNVAAFFTRWLYDLKADQSRDGSVPYVVPDALTHMRRHDPNPQRASGAAAWSDAAVICPWTIYQCYGDRRLLEEQYDSMVGWVEYVRGRAGDACIWRNDPQFGDWLDYRGVDPRRPAPVTNTELVATAFFAHSARLLAQAADVLGRTADVVRYAELAERVKAAFNREFVTPAGRVGPNTQTAYVLALQFGLLPDDVRPLAAERLVQEIRQANYHVMTGFVGTPYVCHVLSSHGYADVAYRLLMQESYPSWLYPVKQGATTIWERWDGIKLDGSFQDASMNSFNHYAYGAIGEWLYRVVAGIEVDSEQPGYKRIHFQPQPGGELRYANATLDSLYGRIESSWQQNDHDFELTVVVPANCEGVVHLPAAAPDDISEQGLVLGEVEGMRTIRQEGGTVILTVGSGRYCFQVAGRRA